MTIGKICTRTVDLATPGESVRHAAERMLERNVGSLVVVGDDNVPIGLVTDRDLALRVVAAGRAADEVSVEEVMTHEPRTVPESKPIEETLAAMRSAAIRRMLVVDDRDRLVGIVTVDDIVALLAEEFRDLGALLMTGPQEHVMPVPGV